MIRSGGGIDDQTNTCNQKPKIKSLAAACSIWIVVPHVSDCLYCLYIEFLNDQPSIICTLSKYIYIYIYIIVL